jgi:hypothetical protein
VGRPRDGARASAGATDVNDDGRIVGLMAWSRVWSMPGHRWRVGFPEPLVESPTWPDTSPSSEDGAGVASALMRDLDDEVAEAGAAVDVGFVWIVDEFDGDELVARKLEHGQVPQAGLRGVRLPTFS